MMRILRILLWVACAAPVTVLAQHPVPDGSQEPRTYTEDAIDASKVAAWREDLDFLVSSLHRIHPEPYWRVERRVLDGAVEQLREQIPLLAAHQIITRMAAILALVGDGHTSLPLYAARGVDFHVIPIRFGVYSGEVYVEAADRRYAALVGGRLVRIGGTPVEEALERVATLISRDNDNWIPAVAPNLLNRIEVLHALDLAASLSGVELTVAHGSSENTLRVEPLAARHPVAMGIPFLPRLTEDWVDARDSAGVPEPWYQRHFDQKYLWRYLEDQDLLYLKWDQVQNRPNGPPAIEVVREAMQFARERSPGKTVIDLRNNTGGEGHLLPAVVREIIRTPGVDEPGRLFVVIGKRTFSAGHMLTAMLDQFSSAILVGEPSSAFYNGYAGHEFGVLPHSGISFAISPDYYQMGTHPGDRRTQATPQLAAIPTFDDYRKNHDRALAVITAYQPGRFSERVAEEADRGAWDEVRSLARAFDSDPVNRFRPARSALNSVGYRLLNEGRQDVAIELFRLNTELHPDYANGWDSLGEALARAHRRDEAIAAYRRALEIDPGLHSAQAAVARLQKLGSE